MRIQPINDNISHKGYKKDLLIMKRKLAVAKFKYVVRSNGQNYTDYHNAQNEKYEFCINNFFKSFLSGELKFSKKEKKEKDALLSKIKYLQTDLEKKEASLLYNWEGKALSAKDFYDIYYSEQDPIKKEKMLLVFA